LFVWHKVRISRRMQRCEKVPPSRRKELDWKGKPVDRRLYARGTTIFAQGDPAGSVLYIEAGVVRLSVVSPGGKEAILGMLGAGHFFGEGCLAGQSHRAATTTAMTAATVVSIDVHAMRHELTMNQEFAGRVFGHMLHRNLRLEEDLIDQLFNSIEKRLARALLLLAHFDESDLSRNLPKISQELLAEMIGTTRTRVNFFMNKFRKLGFIEYDHNLLKVNNSLVGVVLRD
jgi:CRP/FNR family cyclic AMP-dependent transcriptional regulator